MTARTDLRTEPKPVARAQQAEDLAERIQQHIAGLARGRIRDLSVLVDGGCVILRGRSRTQHDKQVAQEAVFDLTDGRGGLANEITVGC